MKLQIQLVPESCWYSNVRSHVTETTWARLRRETASAAGYRCQICGRSGTGHPVECHEIWGYDDTRHIQRLDGLIALCPDCHLVAHFGRAMAQGRTRYALSWFVQVNGLTPEQALGQARAAMALHARRSAHEWALDLSLLSKVYGVRLDSNACEIT